jgi:rubredoxin---NAD+ reductase
VVDPASRPLGALLPEAASEQLRLALQDLGVTWHFGTTVLSVNKVVNQAEKDTETAFQVTLANGETIPADVVLSAIGLRADTRLALAAGLACERGIQVDSALQTSAPNVYALGDSAFGANFDGETNGTGVSHHARCGENARFAVDDRTAKDGFSRAMGIYRAQCLAVQQ